MHMEETTSITYQASNEKKTGRKNLKVLSSGFYNFAVKLDDYNDNFNKN